MHLLEEVVGLVCSSWFHIVELACHATGYQEVLFGLQVAHSCLHLLGVVLIVDGLLAFWRDSAFLDQVFCHHLLHQRFLFVAGFNHLDFVKRQDGPVIGEEGVWPRVMQRKCCFGVVFSVDISVELLLCGTITTEQNTIAPGWGSVLLGSVVVVRHFVVSVCWVKFELAFMESLEQCILRPLVEQLVTCAERSVIFLCYRISDLLVTPVNTIIQISKYTFVIMMRPLLSPMDAEFLHGVVIVLPKVFIPHCRFSLSVMKMNIREDERRIIKGKLQRNRTFVTSISMCTRFVIRFVNVSDVWYILLLGKHGYVGAHHHLLDYWHVFYSFFSIGVQVLQQNFLPESGSFDVLESIAFFCVQLNELLQANYV